MLSLDQLRQHDDWGNAPRLLAPADAAVLEAGAWYRADQNCICETCQREYWRHSQVLGATWLRRLCNLDLVKL